LHVALGTARALIEPRALTCGGCRDRAAGIGWLRARHGTAALRVGREWGVADAVGAAALTGPVAGTRAADAVSAEEPTRALAVALAGTPGAERGILAGALRGAQLARPALWATAVGTTVGDVRQANASAALLGDAAHLPGGSRRIAGALSDVAAVTAVFVTLALDTALAVAAAERVRGGAGRSTTDALSAGARDGLAVIGDAVPRLRTALSEAAAAVPARNALFTTRAGRSVRRGEAAGAGARAEAAALTGSVAGFVAAHAIDAAQPGAALRGTGAAGVALLERAASPTRGLSRRANAAAVGSTFFPLGGAVPNAATLLAGAVSLADRIRDAGGRRAGEPHGRLRVAPGAGRATVGAVLSIAKTRSAGDGCCTLTRHAGVVALDAARAVSGTEEPGSARGGAADRVSAEAGNALRSAPALRIRGAVHAVTQGAGAGCIAVAAGCR
jgi:hypothetical protein